jgi:hypothetical protein
MPSKAEILGLYKKLLRGASTIKLSDKEFYVSKIKDSFRKYKDVNSQQQIDVYYKVIFKMKKLILKFGIKMIENKMGGIL